MLKKMDAGRAQRSLCLRQEGDPELHTIVRQAQRQLALVLPPDRNRWPTECAMDSMMVLPNDLECDVALKLSKRQCRMAFGIVLAPFLDVA